MQTDSRRQIQPLGPAELEAFVEEIEEIKQDAYASISEEDYRHLRKTEWYGRIAAIIGYATAWIIPNPVSVIGLSLAQFTRWLLAHHILHKGYDRVPNIPKRYTSKYFARGGRRFIDWFDWLHPDAWDYEHNILHHYYTGEDIDPDVVERNAELLRGLRLPMPIKYLLAVLVGLTWKYTYYAPSTISTLQADSVKRKKKEDISHLTFNQCFNFKDPHVRRLWLECYFPYGLVHFVVIPLLFYPLGWFAVGSVLINKVLAECLTNFHTYVVILPNHTADDVYRYDFHYNTKAEFYITQVMGSVNYACGDEITDYMHIYLNYQIEHHLFPDLTMLGYRRVQPRVKAVCEKYGIPYLQESVFKRFKKMLDISVGAASMPMANQFDDLQREPA